MEDPSSVFRTYLKDAKCSNHAYIYTVHAYMLTYNPSAEEAKPGESLWLSGRQYDLIIELQTMRDHCLK